MVGPSERDVLLMRQLLCDVEHTETLTAGAKDRRPRPVCTIAKHACRIEYGDTLTIGKQRDAIPKPKPRPRVDYDAL